MWEKFVLSLTLEMEAKRLILAETVLNLRFSFSVRFL